MEEATKRCPYCGEEIKAEAIKCRHCKTMLSDENEVPSSEYIVIRAKELNFWQNIIAMYWLYKRWALKEFMLKDGILTIECQNGKRMQAPIRDVVSTFDTYGQESRRIIVKCPDKTSIDFAIDIVFVITDAEAEQIWEILQPKETALSKAKGILSIFK
jgi:hypothetical protein